MFFTKVRHYDNKKIHFSDVLVEQTGSECDIQPPRCGIDDESAVPGVGSPPSCFQNKKRVTSKRVKACRGFYCCVPLCHSLSGENTERKRLGLPTVSFHCFPDPKTQKGKEWIKRIRRDPGPKFKITKSTKVCSLHFTPEDYVFSELELEFELESCRPRLKPNAYPTVFPWTQTVFQRSTSTSKIAASSQQRCDLISTDSTEPFGHEIPDEPTDGYTTLHEAGERIQDLQIEIKELKEKCQGLEIEVKDLKTDCKQLEVKVQELEDKLQESESNAAQQLFRLENVKQKPGLVKFYTGFPDFDTLMIFYEEVLKDDAEVMRLWKGKDCKDDFDGAKCGRPSKLSLLEQFFMTLVRLRLGLPELDLAN